MKRVPVTCDGCGKTAKCRPNQFGPTGWFYIPILIMVLAGAEKAAVLACSEACRIKAWKVAK